MLEYTGADDEHSCPYFYLWDMQALKTFRSDNNRSDQRRDHRCCSCDTSQVGDLSDYTIPAADDGGTGEMDSWRSAWGVQPRQLIEESMARSFHTNRTV